jgi:NTE family protein
MAEGARRVAIACQGGGSHTAFTAGVLGRLLGADALDRYEIVGLSGTSGGAVCALLAWTAVADGDPGRATELLQGFWADNAATSTPERMMNAATLWMSTMANFATMPAVSPYDSPVAALGLDTFRRMLRRRVDFRRLAPSPDPSRPILVIGAVDVLTGEFRAFNSRCDTITEDTVVASAAIPTLFRAVRVGSGTYWDGLFSQNPPVRNLLEAQPDELWVIQINPTRRDAEPRTLMEIADRRNELSGNLSLYQELHVIEKIDELLNEGLLVPDGRYRPIMVRVIELPRDGLSSVYRSLGATSKINRDPAFLRELLRHGEDAANEFLTALRFEDAWRERDPDSMLDFFADDSELVSAAPFPPHGPSRGAAAADDFLREHIAASIRVDLTRKQIARGEVTWTVRGPQTTGRAVARFSDRRIASLRLGALQE